MSIFYPTTINTAPTTNISQKKQKKTQEKIKSLLKHVVGNYEIFLTSFQEAIIFLQSMDIKISSFLDKF